MTDNGGPSENGEQSASTVARPVTPSTVQDPSGAVLPPFVCVLPCKAPPVKYLDRLDGCASGIHVTREDTKDLQVSLYGTMADAIMAKEDQPAQVSASAPHPCTVCAASLVPKPSFPLLYMENCVHYFHSGCLGNFLSYVPYSYLSGSPGACLQCQVVSSRVLLWPKLFPSEAAKNDTFQLAKRSLGLDIAPQTVLEVRKCYVDQQFPAFDLTVNSKHLTIRKRPPPPQPGECMFTTFRRGNLSILDSQEPAWAAPSCCNCGSELFKEWLRKEALAKFRCPFRRLDGAPNGGQCSGGKDCEFWHESHTGTEMSQGVERSIQPPNGIRDFPRFFCVRDSRIYQTGPYCSERIQVHSQEMVRCLAGFHPTLSDLRDLDGFACKMAKQIMAPVVEPEQPLDCAFCHQPPSEPNSVCMHLQNCVHWLHVSCLPRLAHSTNPNRKLDLHCPTCEVPSVRTLAWPGLFQSDLIKKTIFERQLMWFKLTVQADTQLAIVQVPNQVDTFTLDYGGPSVVTIDAATAQDNCTILYD